jgi:membrane-bound lytic murein transglycosylase D
MSVAEKYSEIPYRTVTVTYSISNLADWAIENGTNYKTLRLMNPWIRGRSLPLGRNKSHVIKLPSKQS